MNTMTTMAMPITQEECDNQRLKPKPLSGAFGRHSYGILRSKILCSTAQSLPVILQRNRTQALPRSSVDSARARPFDVNVGVSSQMHPKPEKNSPETQWDRHLHRPLYLSACAHEMIATGIHLARTLMPKKLCKFGQSGRRANKTLETITHHNRLSQTFWNWLPSTITRSRTNIEPRRTPSLLRRALQLTGSRDM